MSTRLRSRSASHVRSSYALLVLIGTALLLLSAPGVAVAKKCHAGVHSFGKVQARTFCGKASAKVTVPGHKATISGGSCKTTKDYFTINIGTVVLGNAPNKPDYFGITVGKTLAGGSPAGHDGTYGGVISFVIKHKDYAVQNGKVTLTSKRTKGSFSGTLFGGGAVSGTFKCS